MNGIIEVVMCERDRLGRKLQTKTRCMSQSGRDAERFAVREILKGVKKYQRESAIDRFFGEGVFADEAK